MIKNVAVKSTDDPAEVGHLSSLYRCHYIYDLLIDDLRFIT